MNYRIVRYLLILLAVGLVPMVVHAEDCSAPSPTGTATVNPSGVSCAYEPTVEGPQNGNLVVATGKTLTIKSGQSIMWNPGYTIDLSQSGAQIAVIGTGTIKKGDICLTDTDGDGYPDSPSHDTQTVGPCVGAQQPRKTLAHPTLQDCNPTNPSIGIATTCYPDADGDGVFSPNSVSVCQASCTGSYSATPGTDCNDGNANVWLSHAQCYADNDKDTYTNGLASNTTCLNTSSCATATYASASTDGAVVTSYQAGQLRNSANGNDCNDANAAKWQNLSCYVDADGDGYTVGSAGSVCSGASCPSGYSSSSSGTDCCDSDNNAHPGADYHASQDACSSWDWNCVNGTEKEYVSLVNASCSTCTSDGGSCAIDVGGSVGWTASSPPACGVTAAWISGTGSCTSGPYPSCPSGCNTTTNQQQCK